MKRKLIIMGVVILLILTNTIAIFAADETTVTLEASKTEVKVGETFTVLLKAKCPDGIGTLETTYTYDKEKLELKSEEVVNSNFFNLNLDNGVIMQEGLISVMSSATEGDVYMITFQVKENVEANSTITVNFAETVIGAWNTEAEYTIPAQEISVKVVEETTGGEQNPPTEEDKTAPTVESIAVTSPVSGTYKTGQEIKITATFSEEIAGTTMPTLKIKFGESEERTITTGTISGKSIVYTYKIVDNDKGQLTLTGYTGGEIKDLAGNDAVITSKVLTGNTIKANIEEIPEDNEQTEVDTEKTTEESINQITAKDESLADKEYYKAGIGIGATIGIISLIAVAIVLYSKYYKIRDI